MIELMSQEEITRAYGRSMYQEGYAEGFAEGQTEIYIKIAQRQKQEHASPEAVQALFKKLLDEEISLEKINEWMA